MVRVHSHSNWGVYVPREVGERHKGAHAHLKLRGTRIATVQLMTLTWQWGTEKVPAELVSWVEDHQEELLKRWEELNGD